MPLQQLLIDSSFLFAALQEGNPQRDIAVAALSFSYIQPIIPYIVLTETAFLFRRAGGVPSVLEFLDSLTEFRAEFEGVSKADLKRAREVMAFYPRSRLDFVDCCIVAIAERLNITRICTFDRRDFSIIRPSHCEAFDLLP